MRGALRLSARFAAHRYRFPGVDVRARLFRDYPQGELFSHVIGHIGRISQKDLDRLETQDRLSNYRGTDYIGKTGLEYYYEEHLQDQMVQGMVDRLAKMVPANPANPVTLADAIALRNRLIEVGNSGGVQG